MRSSLVFLLGLCAGIVSGQYLMRYAYDPAVLENNAVSFAASAYSLGCAEAGKVQGACREKAGNYGKDMMSIFKDKIWRKHELDPSKR